MPATAPTKSEVVDAIRMGAPDFNRWRSNHCPEGMLNLYEADLGGLDLSHMQLFDARLIKANLEGCQMEHTCLRWANLHGARLRGAYMPQVNFYKARLLFADLRDCFARKALLEGANLAFGDARSAKLGKAEWLGANLFSLKINSRTQIDRNVRAAVAALELIEV